MKQRYFLVDDNQTFDNTLEQCIEWKSLFVCNCDVLVVVNSARERLQEVAEDAKELSEEEGAKLLGELYSNREERQSEFYYYDNYLYVQFDFEVY